VKRTHASLLSLVSLLILLLAGPALAEVSLVAPDGALIPGRPNRLLVVLHRDGRALTEALPAVAAEPGLVELAEGRLRDGVYGYRYIPPANASGQVTFTIGTGSGGMKRVHMPLASLPAPVLVGPERLDVVAGEQPQVLVTLRGEDIPSAEEVRAKLSEGSVLGIEPGDGELLVRIALGEERFPRVALLAVHDLRYPDHPPAWVPIRVIGRPRIPVRTEPGAQVTLQIGKRSYGPFEANDEGEASASISAWPGEETATVTITDPTGNTQRSTLNLAREHRPLLMHLSAPARPASAPMAPLYLAALDAHGHPWTGAVPRCSVSPQGGGALVTHAPGRFVLVPIPPQEESYLDLEVDCEIPGTLASSRARLPMGRGIPEQLTLRIYPAALSADFPVAQVQVLLEDRIGERIPAAGVTVEAQHGSVVMQRMEGGALRGEYNGAAAGGMGEDTIRAQFQRDPGSGPVTMLTVGHGRQRMAQGRTILPVHGRAMDALGRPLEGVELQLSLGAQRAAATTDVRGWASVAFELLEPGRLNILECRARDRIVREPFLPGSPGEVVRLDSADLTASVEVPISAGRVREVFIETLPAVLHSGPSAVARVRVRLVDRHGNAVTDETIRVEADTGEVGALRTTADATYEAWYRPPSELRAGTVILSAHSQEGAVVGSTKLELLPKPLNWAAGVSIGGLSNLGSINAVMMDLSIEGHLLDSVDWLLVRGSASFYSKDNELLDELTGSVIEVSNTFVPLVLSASVRHERGLNALNVGGGLVALVYRSETLFGDSPSNSGLGLGGPGLSLHTGLARRIGLGELTLEARYLLVLTHQGGFDYNGSVGGVALLPGYRVLF
jgi:hypothetical protein